MTDKLTFWDEYNVFRKKVFEHIVAKIKTKGEEVIKIDKDAEMAFGFSVYTDSQIHQLRSIKVENNNILIKDEMDLTWVISHDDYGSSLSIEELIGLADYVGTL